MATRTDRVLDHALITTRTVTAGQTVSVGRVAKDGGADHEVQHSADGADAIGVIYALGPLNGAAGDLVQLVYLAGACIVPVKVGTGGATRGKAAACVADGVTNAVDDAVAVGFFTQSGVAGDVVGMVPARARG
jgi:hypothetical protein